MPARARCVWSKSELARQTCPERVDRGRKQADGKCQTGAHRLHPLGIEYAQVVTDLEDMWRFVSICRVTSLQGALHLLCGI